MKSPQNFTLLRPKFLLCSKFSLFLFLGLVLVTCKKTETPDAIKDYIHYTADGAIFRYADDLKYGRYYRKAIKAFQKVMDKQRLNYEQRCYAYNQMAYLYLTLYEDSLAYNWIDSIRSNIDLANVTKGAQADFWYNEGLFALRAKCHQWSKKALERSVALYPQVYSDVSHLKTALAYAQLGMVYYSFEKDVRPLYRFTDTSYNMVMENPDLWPHSIEIESIMMYVSRWRKKVETMYLHSKNVLAMANEIEDDLIILKAKALSTQGAYKLYLAYGKSKTSKTDSILAIINFNESVRLGKKINNRLYAEMLHRRLKFYHHFKCYKSINRDLKILETIRAKDSTAIISPKLFLSDTTKNSNQTALQYAVEFYDSVKQDSTVNDELLDDVYTKISRCYQNKQDYDSALYWIIAYIVRETPREGHKLSYTEAMNPTIYKGSPFPYWSINKLGSIRLAQAENTKTLTLKQREQYYKDALSAFQLSDSLLRADMFSYDQDLVYNIIEQTGNDIAGGALKAICFLDSIKPASNYKELAAHFFDFNKSEFLFRYSKMLKTTEMMKLQNRISELSVDSNLLLSQNRELTFLNHQLNKYELIDSGFKYSSLRTEQVVSATPLNTAVLQFRICKNDLYLLLTSQEKATLLHLPIPDELDSLVATVSSEANKVSLSKTLHQLYTLLISPVKAELDYYAQWIIIPDGVLYHLPFEALIESDKVTEFDRNTPFLITSSPNLSIVYSPAWKIFQQNIHKNKFEKTPQIKYLFDDSPKSGLLSVKEEKKFFSSMKEKGKINLEIFPGSKALFKKEWEKGGSDVFHLSFHGKANPTNYFDQKLWLNKTKKIPLYAFEVANFRGGGSDLVVLSACETAIGKIAPGEGVFSLARGFFQGGAKRVMATLWIVSEGPNTKILEFFYKDVQFYENQALALSNAKRKYLMASQDFDKTPKYWAAILFLD